LAGVHESGSIEVRGRQVRLRYAHRAVAYPPLKKIRLESCANGSMAIAKAFEPPGN
jgi:hypothetical protein